MVRELLVLEGQQGSAACAAVERVRVAITRDSRRCRHRRRAHLPQAASNWARCLARTAREFVFSRSALRYFTIVKLSSCGDDARPALLLAAIVSV